MRIFLIAGKSGAGKNEVARYIKEYYIYKGERKEISDFDKAWLDKNCPNIKVQEVH